MNIFLIIGVIVVMGSLIYWKRDWIKRNSEKVAIAGTTVFLTASIIAPVDRLLKVNDIPDFLNVDGREISIQYTDNNSGENLIIKTDSENYYGWGGSIIFYFSVTNVSAQDQNAQIMFSNNDIDVLAIQKFVRNDEVVIATTTENKPAKIVTTVWEDISIEDVKSPIGIVTRKDMKSSITENQFITSINSGETQFFKGRLKIPNTVNGEEWFIEAIGSKDDYGHLDPTGWTDEIDFESPTYDLGALNGQDSWTSGYSGHQVQATSGTSVLEGSQSVATAGTASGMAFAGRALTASDDGIVYIQMHHTIVAVGNSSWVSYWNLRGASDWIIYATFCDDGNIYVGSGCVTDSGINFTVDTDAVLKIDYNTDAEDTYFIDYWESGSWAGQAGPYTPNSDEPIISIRISFAEHAGTVGEFLYWDNLTTNDPTVAVDTCSCPDSGDWNIDSDDNCWLSTTCHVYPNSVNLYWKGSGAFNISASGILNASAINSTSTPINAGAGAQINLY